ncbi:hypothetical protein PI125_g4782 [Phytophthora idaei]|nr:hypothetical protein PI125_g4782 [Phytophthora idaei]
MTEVCFRHSPGNTNVVADALSRGPIRTLAAVGRRRRRRQAAASTTAADAVEVRDVDGIVREEDEVAGDGTTATTGNTDEVSMVPGESQQVVASAPDDRYDANELDDALPAGEASVPPGTEEHEEPRNDAVAATPAVPPHDARTVPESEEGEHGVDVVMDQLCAHYFSLHVSARVRGSVVCLNLG